MTIQPRPWIDLQDLINEDHTELLCPVPESVTEVAVEAGIEIATAVLYEVTGRRWSGSETSSVRPKAQDSSSLEKIPGWVPSWGEFDSSVGSCSPSASIDLGFFPVSSISEVKIDGAVVSPSTYQLQNQKTLVRIDGNVWPCDQDLSSPTTALNTFVVTFSHGIEPPLAGKHCCAVYAVELAKSFCNLDCALPQRTQYMTRQGISTILLDPLNVIERGMIGLPTVDAWVRAVNPHRRRKRSRMISGLNSGEDEKETCSPPMSASRLNPDYYAYPRRGVNRFCG
jgi:hypothetical protein